jgi:hypothetical protein
MQAFMAIDVINYCTGIMGLTRICRLEEILLSKHRNSVMFIILFERVNLLRIG